jgi:GTP-binding protein LepA
MFLGLIIWNYYAEKDDFLKKIMVIRQKAYRWRNNMEKIDQSHIRNFCIVAHIDHGKSTLADRIIEKTGLLTSREMQAQVLDNMELERERGITIKAQTVRIVYRAKNGEEYIFNLIDTPGHVDFNYEVSRSLAACEGAILIVDAAQGVEAQTLANCYLALDHDLEILPVINKIDLPSAEPERVKEEIEDVIGLDASDAPLISAKMGTNIEEVLEQIITKIPAPSGDENSPLQALIFDSIYDAYKGVIIFCRIFDGSVKKGDEILMMATGAKAEVVEVGIFGAGQYIASDELSAGMVGYITASLKDVHETRVGDTVTLAKNPCKEALPGYKQVQPMVYCGLYPADGAKYNDLRDALEKLQLNDAALQFEAETSVALGFGFRCGFLGLLHLEIIQERLEREYNLDLVTTAPGVVYHIYKTNGEMVEVTNPSNLPDPSEIERMEEPIVSAEIMVTTEFVGAIMTLCQERRGVYLGMEYLEETRAVLKYDLPLNEIIYDFFDALKSRSRGYASLDYEMKGYAPSRLVKLDILINKEEIDALSFILHADTAYERGRKMCEKLKQEIPRQLFEIPIQAAVGSKVIARETVRAVRKDVLAKCYGGDISRKRKLLEKQKEGKKRMRQFGNVEIPQEAFMSVLKLDEE